jgi:nicotinate-nucleotide pyrophosphorylase (carboxylating)
VVAREAGLFVGLEATRLILEEMQLQLTLLAHVEEGATVARGEPVLTLQGSARDLLTAERTILNFVGRLSGVASQTAQFVRHIAHTRARLYDTRKTTPGWRRLEKYAVRCGGGWNHRTGLYDAILIKDNHLALGQQLSSGHRFSPAEAVRQARAFAATMQARGDVRRNLMVEVELDTLDTFGDVLAAEPDIILLDNMSLAQLAEAVRARNACESSVQLEASGGVRLATIGAIAETGVDRISCGFLTHSAVNFDFGLDWFE